MDVNTIAKLKSILETKLSVQERKVLVLAIRARDGRKFFVTDIRATTRITQTNHLHAILGRLVKKGVLVKLGRAEYAFKDPELVEHIKNRCN